MRPLYKTVFLAHLRLEKACDYVHVSGSVLQKFLYRAAIEDLYDKKAAFQMIIGWHKSELYLRSRQNVLHKENCSINSGGFEPLADFSQHQQGTVIEMFTVNLQFNELGLAEVAKAVRRREEQS